MPSTQSVLFVPEMSNDARIRVFRRAFDAVGEFEGMEVDAYIVITTTTVVVLDTLLCPEDVESMMEMVQSDSAGRQILVVNSHADWDHAWGNAYFTGKHSAPIIAHEHGMVRMLSEEAQVELADFQQRYPIFQNVTLLPATLTFKTGLTIHGGDLTIELMPAPGHHRDHIAAWIPELRLLLAFDAVEKPLPCLENAEAVPSMVRTLEHFLAMEPERVLCSHGKTTSPQLVKENLTYLREIERRSQVLLREHQPSDVELEHAATAIHYPFDEVVAGLDEPVDRTFYSWAHDANARYMLQWLMKEAAH
jgi:glyoxylase-like metal-dependent hydrolase (beta-lactamase superfamily II)